MRGTLSPKLKEFIASVNVAAAEFKASGVELTPTQARANLQKLSAFVTQPVAITFSESAVVTVNNGLATIPVQLMSDKPNQSLPILVYFHGGGHMCGDIPQYEPLARRMVKHSNCHVVLVDYRRSPEFRYPAGIEDCELVLAHLNQIQELAHNGEIFIGGDSAGGAISSSILMRQAKGQSLCPEVVIDKQLLIYPSLDYTGSTASYLENGTGYLLEHTRIDWYFDHYFNTASERQAASPLFGPLLTRYPKTLILTASCDPLRDEGEQFAARLAEAGKSVSHYQFEGMIHAFMNLEDLIVEECQDLHRRIGAFLAN